MFQTDSKTLEELSFKFNEMDLSNFKATLEYIMKNTQLTIPKNEIEKTINAIDKIGELKLEGKIYGFHINDNWYYQQSGIGEGYILFLRQGNTLREYLREYKFISKKSFGKLLEEGYTTIYTGDIPIEKDFLGVTYDNRDKDSPVITTILEDSEIKEFENGGIEVITLDSLI